MKPTQPTYLNLSKIERDISELYRISLNHATRLSPERQKELDEKIKELTDLLVKQKLNEADVIEKLEQNEQPVEVGFIDLLLPILTAVLCFCFMAEFGRNPFGEKLCSVLLGLAAIAYAISDLTRKVRNS